MACIPTASCMFPGSCAPIENSPPGIHTMPSGAGPGGGFLFSTVGRNRFDVAASTAGSAGSADGLGRVAVKATIAAAAIITTATHVQTLLLRRGTDTVLIGCERRLPIGGSGSNCSMSRLQFSFAERDRGQRSAPTVIWPGPRNTVGPAFDSAILQREFVEPARCRQIVAQTVPDSRYSDASAPASRPAR